MAHVLIALALLLQPTTAPAETTDVRVVSYNIENFAQNFTAYALDKKYRQNDAVPEDLKNFIRYERRADREENYEVAEVIKAMKPDILAVQESAKLEDLAYFNEEFLDNYFGTIQQMPTNTTRDQHLTIMLRPGFEVVDIVTLYEVPDVNDYNDRGDRLFARGAGFVLIKTPEGRQFWVGNTHQKSKGGNSVRTTRWRNLEATTTRDKAIELAASAPVLLVGDMNDTLGVGEFEAEGGGDVMTNLSAGLTLLTRKLSDEGVETFKGYGGSRYGGFIDHALATENMLPFVKHVEVFTGSLTDTASDHLPVVVDLAFPVAE
ncbi:MAG: endonuclease/exonuclease/phosphatase family protein [Planctomycetota bacterium]